MTSAVSARLAAPTRRASRSWPTASPCSTCWAPRFTRICLNRNRLLLDGYADRPEGPHAATHGSVANRS
jgi:siderophore synthetase component